MRNARAVAVHRTEYLPAVDTGTFQPVPLCRAAGANAFSVDSQVVTCKNCRRMMRRTAWYVKLGDAMRAAGDA